jgi:hypothetical protein
VIAALGVRVARHSDLPYGADRSHSSCVHTTEAKMSSSCAISLTDVFRATGQVL